MNARYRTMIFDGIFDGILVFQAEVHCDRSARIDRDDRSEHPEQAACTL
ncbi:MAG: hypothetical protein HC770_06520 [Pseudanabaena sp. CRU_2_10]|nr:hypothetical protein [Pseudanabaena sp. CRU_2_10]